MRLAFSVFLFIICFATIAQHTGVSSNGRRWIVRFKTESSGRASAEQTHAQFLDDLAKIAGPATARTGNTPHVHHEFNVVFDGFCISATDEVKEKLEGLPYVDYIREDKKLKLLDTETNSRINAPDVWSRYGATGKGISIAIIDTGVDYNHPELGGGIGPGFKVLGGYDFSDADPDPMDNYGHGTHVAGIAAANGPQLKGVAPDANLYAFKIYSTEGYSYDSWMIAAIERCFDPDLNPATDDAIDIANISFGRPFDPYEPLSEAVNNAVESGLIVVTAAGNDGLFESIYTPGSSENAITVGASDNNDLPLWFSAKGPVNNFNVKPDVLAPGTNVLSSWMNNTYVRETGTSMATPHVAGAVALIKEKHPNWTPLVIKGALMATAKRINGQNLLATGAGRIDVLKAVEAKLIASPGMLSLGLLNGTKALNSITRSITLYNTDLSSMMPVTLSFEETNIGTPLVVTFSIPAVEIPPGGSVVIDISFNIDTQTLPKKVFPALYEGKIIGSSSQHEIRIPFSFFHSDGVDITFSDNEPPDSLWIIGTGANANVRITKPDASTFNTIVSPGTYDIIAHYGGTHLVIKEDIIVPGENAVTISKSDAKNELTFKSVDENDLPPHNLTQSFISVSGQNRNYYGFFSGKEKLYTSDLSAYQLNFRSSWNNTIDRIYDISLSAYPPLKNSASFKNDPAGFTQLRISNPDISAGTLNMVRFHTRSFPFITSSPPLNLMNPFDVYISRNDPDERLNSSLALITGTGSPTWQTGAFTAFTDGTIEFADLLNNSLTIVPATAFHLETGSTIPAPDAYTNNLPDKIRLTDIPELGYFKHGLGEYARSLIQYKISKDNNIVKEGEFLNRIVPDALLEGSTFPELSVAPGEYTLELMMSGNKVGATTGKVNLALTFNTGSDDSNPPLIERLSLEAGGIPTNTLLSSETATLLLVTGDNCRTYGPCDDPDEIITEVYIKHESAADWTNLPLPADYDETHELQLPSNLTGMIDLRIRLTDRTGNALEYLVTPAFQVITPPLHAPGVLLVSPINSAVTDITPVLRWEAAEQTGFFEIEISQSSDFSGNTVRYETVGNEMRVYEPLEYDKTLYWRVRVVSLNRIKGEWSSPGVFSTIPRIFQILLLTPLDKASHITQPVSFEWTNINSPYYVFQLAHESDFATPVIDTILYSSGFTIDEIDSNDEYFWRVGFRLDNVMRWSLPFNFSTDITAGTESENEIKFFVGKPNPLGTKTVISFKSHLSEQGDLIIYNLVGAPVFQHNFRNTGEEYEIEWLPLKNGTPLPSGIYIARLTIGSESRTLRLILRQ